MEQRKKEKLQQTIIGFVVYGGIGLWLLESYLSADQHKQEYMWILLIAGAAFWEIRRRLDYIVDKLDELTDKHK